MRRAYQYRLYPTPKQEQALEALLQAGRQLYNAALEHRLLCWQRYRRSISYLDQSADLKAIRRELPEIGVLNFSACQQILRRLDKNFRAFLQGIRKRPRFKTQERFRSLEFRFGDGATLTNTKRLKLQNVGIIRVRWHREFPQDASVKDVVVTRHSDGKWLATFRLDLPDPRPQPHAGPAVGLDLGLYSLITLSDGTTVDAPRFYRKAEERLSKIQQKYSLNRTKRAHRKLAYLHAKVSRQRKDFLHKLSHWLVHTYSLIVVEDLDVKRLCQAGNGGLRKSMHDAAWGMLLAMLDYKAANAGSRVVRVTPNLTSQECSGCGATVSKSLDVRQHICLHCGLVLDRDINSARNILKRALGWDAAFRLMPEKHRASAR